MPLPISLSKPPQTAADLLEGLLRSRLLAESLFGQLSEQSAPFVERRADEFAAALVEKRVLTQWQATELLAGRQALYGGTFRLLERLAGTDSTEVFVAEQPGSQRLVMLQMTRVERMSAPAWPESGGGRDAECATSKEPHGLPRTARHPHLARCLGTQRTPQLNLVAYEFLEAKPLAELLTRQPLPRKHAAELMRQFTAALVVLHDEALTTIGLDAAWVDRHGELKLLAGPDPIASESQLSQSSPGRMALQMRAIQRFAATLGGPPEISNCRSVTEVMQRLVGIAEPWTNPFASESLRCQRVWMNRLLRRGPALRLIEDFSPELQVAFAESVAEPASGAVTAESAVHCPVLMTAVGSCRLPKNGTHPARIRPKDGPGRRALAHTALLWLLATGVVATQWYEHRGVKGAEATTTPAQHPRTQTLLNPEPSRTGHFPVPQ